MPPRRRHFALEQRRGVDARHECDGAAALVRDRGGERAQLVLEDDVIVFAARVAGDAAARAPREAIGGDIGLAVRAGVGVRERDGDEGPRRRGQRAGVAALVGLRGQIAHLGGVAAREPVAIDVVARQRRHRREADALKAQRCGRGAEERGGGGGIEGRLHDAWLA